MHNQLLTMTEAARRLRISRNTLYKLKYAGTLPQPIRIGRRSFYTQDQIERWLDQRIEAAEAEATKAALAA